MKLFKNVNIVKARDGNRAWKKVKEDVILKSLKINFEL